MNIFFIGIAGAGMGSLAKYLLEAGGNISGSDPYAPEKVREHWRSLGCTVFDNHDAAHVANADQVVYSAAIPLSNPELEAARIRDIDVARGVALALVANDHGGSIAVCGTHGKGTTAGAIVHILQAAGIPPGYILGAQPVDLSSPSHFEPNSNYLVCEVDESDRTNHWHKPRILLLNNVEADHLNNYGDLEDIVDSFANHIEKCLSTGSRIIIHYAGVGAPLLWARTSTSQLIWIAPENGPAEVQWHYRTVSTDEDGRYTVELWSDTTAPITLKCNLPGYANAQNMVSAAVVALVEHIPADVVCNAIHTYRGLKDRCEITYNGSCSLVTDYASHPTCVANDISWTRLHAKRIIALYHPYRYSLMRYHWDALAESLSTADAVIIPPIDGAGESPFDDIDSPHLAGNIRNLNPACEARAFETFEEAEKAACEMLTDGDRLIVFGGGSLFDMGRRVLASHHE